MMKKPWYIWLSLIGFGIIFYRCSIQLLYDMKKRDYNLWFRFLGKSFGLWVLILMIPIGVMLFIMEAVLQAGSALGTVINIVILIYVYLSGVVISEKLFHWKKKNLNIDSGI